MRMFMRDPRKGRVALSAILVMIAYTLFLSLDLGNGCKHIGGEVNAFVYPLMLNDPYYVLLLSISLVYFFIKNEILCPAKSKFRYTVSMRTAILAGIKLSIFSCLASMIGVIPYASFGREWGLAINALGTYAKGRMLYWRISHNIVSTISPPLALLEATCLTAVYSLFVSILVEHSRKSHIILVATIMMCFSDFQVINELPSRYTYVFPPSIMRIALTSQSTFIYAMTYFLFFSALLLILLRKRRDKV